MKWGEVVAYFVAVDGDFKWLQHFHLVYPVYCFEATSVLVDFQRKVQTENEKYSSSHLETTFSRIYNCIIVRLLGYCSVKAEAVRLIKSTLISFTFTKIQVKIELKCLQNTYFSIGFVNCSLVSAKHVPVLYFTGQLIGRVMDRTKRICSCSEAVDAGSIPGPVKPKTIKICIHNFPAWRSALKTTEWNIYRAW